MNPELSVQLRISGPHALHTRARAMPPPPSLLPEPLTSTARLTGATGRRLEESKKINQSLSALGTQLETRNPKPETLNPNPEHRTPNPEISNPRPQTPNPKQQTPNLKAQTRNPNASP